MEGFVRFLAVPVALRLAALLEPGRPVMVPRARSICGGVTCTGGVENRAPEKGSIRAPVGARRGSKGAPARGPS
eukprot:7816860-Pyramimonas_sp.AAC.1